MDKPTMCRLTTRAEDEAYEAALDKWKEGRPECKRCECPGATMNVYMHFIRSHNLGDVQKGGVNLCHFCMGNMVHVLEMLPIWTVFPKSWYDPKTRPEWVAHTLIPTDALNDNPETDNPEFDWDLDPDVFVSEIEYPPMPRREDFLKEKTNG